MSKRTALIMAGGTGGHIFPALAVADQLREKGWDIIWLGAEGGMETRIVPPRGYTVNTLAIKGLRGNGLLGWLKLPFTLLRAFSQCAALILSRRPDVAFGFGGYTAFAGGVMMRFFWKPLVIHEQNSVAGLTNRVLAKIASRTLYAFPTAFSDKTGLVGNPVREEIARLPLPAQRFAERQGPLRILVVGGSLGAKVFNDVVPAALALLPVEKRPTVIHQAGKQHIEALQQAYQTAAVQADTRAFIDDMAAEYAKADILICRAGALTIAELAAAGCASILVPFPHAVDDHQTGNARLLSDCGAAWLIPQPELTAAKLAELLSELSRDTCLTMAEKARQHACPDAAKRVAEIGISLTA